MKTRRLVGVALAAILWLLAGVVSAHKASDSYLTLTRSGSDAANVGLRWDIALRDLDNAITLDANGDGDINWGEVRSKQAQIAAYALSRLAVLSKGAACPLHGVGAPMIDTHSDGSYVVLRFDGVCPRPGTSLTLDYRLLFDIDPQHRGLLQFDDGGAVRSVIFSVGSPRQTIGGGSTGAFEQLRQYIDDGVWHIWFGFDHILFLLSLLLPAVLLRRDQRWRPAASFRATFIDVAKVVTAFTLAHSITLSLATFGLISPNARWVDAGIALSVVLAAANNVFPVVNHGRWIAAFGFGLIHGFGFASALKGLGLPTGSLVLSLFGFNVGVELGQIAVVVLFLPIAFALRETWAYRRVIFTGGSAAIATVAGAWFIERAFNVSLQAIAFAK